jgi:hypothetical protein
MCRVALSICEACGRIWQVELLYCKPCQEAGLTHEPQRFEVNTFQWSPYVMKCAGLLFLEPTEIAGSCGRHHEVAVRSGTRTATAESMDLEDSEGTQDHSGSESDEIR